MIGPGGADDVDGTGDGTASAVDEASVPSQMVGAEERVGSLPLDATLAPEALPSLIRARLKVKADARLGRYVILRTLGEGGMGVVFSAFDEELDRRVAIKVLSDQAAGGTTGRARIRREAQALAKLSHPNIVQIYEVGEDSGQIYLVMEMIEGQDLRRWRKAADRGWREVVARYIEAGRGLAAAHRAGLVHRDFKPENAIVGLDGRVRVVDFGVARVASEEATTQREVISDDLGDSGETLTVAGSLLGTPAYMAPEQRLRQTADHRADVFSFAVALFEALYGHRPFEGRGEALTRAILSGEIREPAAGTKVPARLRRILGRGLLVDPAERWQTIDAMLSALADDPTQRRWRWAGALGIAGAAALAGTLLRPVAVDAPDPCAGVDADFAVGWDEARARAVGEALIASGIPHAASTWARARERLDAYAEGLRGAALAACEDAHVRGRHSPALADRRLACLRARDGELVALAESLADGGAAAVESVIPAVGALTPIASCDVDVLLAERMAPPKEGATAAEVEAIRGELTRIKAMSDAGRFREVVEAAEAAVGRAEALDYPPIQAEAHLRRALLHDKIDDDRIAEAEYTAAWFAALASDHDEVAEKTAAYLSRLLAGDAQRLGEAATWIETADALGRRRGDDPIRAIHRLKVLARIDEIAGRYPAARDRLQEALAIAEVSDPASREVSLAHEALSLVLRLTGDYAGAVEHSERALEGARAIFGDDHPHLGALYQQQGMLFDDIGDRARAEAATGRALELFERAYGPESPTLAYALNDLGSSLCGRGRLAEGVAALERARDLRIAAMGREHMLVTTVLYNLGNCLHELGRTDEARALLVETLEIRERLVGADHPKVAFPHLGLGDIELDAGDLDRAEAHFRRALEIREASLGGEHMRVAFPLIGLAKVALGRAQPAEAIALAERALGLHEATTDDPTDLADARFTLALALGDAGLERGRARALAEAAQGGFQAAAGAHAKELAAVEVWLRERPADPPAPAGP